MTLVTLTPRAEREQRTFRVLLNAMARPGQVDSIPMHENGGEYAAILSIAEALIDHEVDFAVAPERADLIDAVLRQTGGRVAALEDAGYVLCDSTSLVRVLEEAGDGTLEYPDHGATVICRVEAIETAGALVLRGPGIKDMARVAIDGFSEEARAALAERNSRPPLGLDVIFVTADGRVVCINRNTRIEKESE